MPRIHLMSACLVLSVALAGQALHAADLKPDADGYLRDWLVLDPFEIGDKAGENTEEAQKAFFAELIPNQFKATPKAGEIVRISPAAGDRTWKAIHSEEPAVMIDAKENSMYLAVVYVTSPVAVAEARLSIGSDDGSSWRVGPSEVLTVYAGRPVALDENTSRPFTLAKGVNVIRVAIINGPGDVGLSARILDPAGKPLTDLTVSLAPPKE